MEQLQRSAPVGKKGEHIPPIFVLLAAREIAGKGKGKKRSWVSPREVKEALPSSLSRGKKKILPFGLGKRNEGKRRVGLERGKES